MVNSIGASGSPSGVRSGAAKLGRVATLVDDHADRILAIGARVASPASWQGEDAEAFHATISTRAAELRRTSDSLRSAGSALRQYAEVLEQGQLMIASLQRKIADLKDDERDDNPDTLEDEGVDNSGRIRGVERQITGILNQISDAAVAAASALNGLEVTSAPTEAGMFSALADSTGLTATMAELERLRTAPAGNWENLFSTGLNGLMGLDQLGGFWLERNVMDPGVWRDRVSAYMAGDQTSDVWDFLSPEMDAEINEFAARGLMAWRNLTENEPATNGEAFARLFANLPVALNHRMDEFNAWMNTPEYWDVPGMPGTTFMWKGRLPWQADPSEAQIAETKATQLAAQAAFEETWGRVSEDWERVNEGGGAFAYYGGGLEFNDWSIGGTKLDDWYQAPGEQVHFETGPLIELSYAEIFKKIQALTGSGGIGIAPGEGAHRLREGLVFFQPGKGQLHGKWGRAKASFGPGLVLALTPGETETDPWSLSIGLLFNGGLEFKAGRIGAEIEGGIGGYLTFEPWGSAASHEEPHAGEVPAAADAGHEIPGTAPTTAPATAPSTGPTVIPGMPAAPTAQPPAQPPAAPPVAPVTPMQPAPPAQPPAAPPAPPAQAPQAYTIQQGDTLRGIATDHLPPGQRSEADIQAYWKEIYRLNRSVLGPNPDLIHTGVQLTIPPPPSALPAAS
jgi:hypothetical protein